MRSFTKIFRDWLNEPLPPAAQGPAGLKVDSDFNPPAGFWGTLLGRGSDGRIYTMNASDAKRLRPIILRSERAVKNEEIAARARAARNRTDVPISIIRDRPEEFEPLLEAEILPAAPRPVPDWIETDVIEPPRQGGGDGNSP
jgi:hypothetical protein